MLMVAASLLWLEGRALDESGARYGVGVATGGVARLGTFPAK